MPLRSTTGLSLTFVSASEAAKANLLFFKQQKQNESKAGGGSKPSTEGPGAAKPRFI